MKFLADMDISPKAVTFLQNLKHDAVHLHELGLDTLSDSEILEKAISGERILITHDLGFEELIAKRKTRLPNTIVFRLRNISPEKVNQYLKEIITQHSDSLQQGVIMSVTELQIRIRTLPIKSE